MRIRILLGILSLACLLSSCETNGASAENNPDSTTLIAEELSPPERPCGNSVLVDVRDLEGKSVGVFETLNDERHLWLVYSPSISNRLIRANLYIGPAESLPRDGRGNDLMSEFPIRVENREGAIGWMYPVPLDSLPECFVVAACIHIADRELEHPLPRQIRLAWAQGNRADLGLHSIAYCTGTCSPIADQCPGGTEPGMFRTLTPEQWAEAGGDGAEYLESKFAKAFSGGLRLGCDKKVVFSTPEALAGFFPSSGPAAVLESDAENPSDLGNGLAAEICALTLSIGFDEYDEGYCQSQAQLSTLQIATGPFAGWNIRDILNEANTVLGGCTSNYSAGQMMEVLRSVNENFSKGELSRGFLRCQGS